MTEIVLEFGRRPPSVNGGHGNRYQKAATTKLWRTLGRSVMQEAINEGRAPRHAEVVTITAQQLAKHGGGHQDLGNALPAVKAIEDGIVDTGFIPDDTPAHVVRLSFIPPDACGRDGLRVYIGIVG